MNVIELEQFLGKLKTELKAGNSSEALSLVEEQLDEIKCYVDFEAEAGYKLSENQVLFCREADLAELEIDFNYSGRGMFGDRCPAVRGDFKTSANVCQDSMGLGVVLYARH